MKKLFKAITFLSLLSLAFAEKTIGDLAAFITPENVAFVLSLFTGPLTSLVKRWIKTQDAATVWANVIINFLTKGVTMVLLGEADIWYALAFVIGGILFDQAVYYWKKQTTPKQVTP